MRIREWWKPVKKMVHVIDLLNIQASIDNEENRKVDLQNSLQTTNLLEYTTGTKQRAGHSFDFWYQPYRCELRTGCAETNNVDLSARDKNRRKRPPLSKLPINHLLAWKPQPVTRMAMCRISWYVFHYMAGISFSVPIYNGGKKKQQKLVEHHLKKTNRKL